MNLKKAVLLSLIAAVALAQPRKPARLPSGARNRMEAVKVWKLTSVLNLTDKQIDEFIPKMRKYEKSLEEERSKWLEVVQRAHELLNQDKVTQKEVNKILKQAIEHRKKMEKIQTDWINQLPKYLTPRQQLKYLGFEMRFRKQVGKFLRERRRFGPPHHRQGPPAGRPMGPPDFYDD